MKNSLNTIVLALLVLALGLLAWRFYGVDSFDLPRGGDAVPTTVEVEQQSFDDDEPVVTFETQDILTTDNVKHSVPLEEIRSGGPPRDGIPPVDDPKFISIEEAGATLADDEPGIVVTRGDESRFYPYQILVWHEIVNDTIDGQRILVTYCPLCFSGIVFDPVVQGERVEFGTSGKLWNSNLVMYDRKTDSLWSQVLGEAIVGEETGQKLKILEYDLMRFGHWSLQWPEGKVLSRDTGAFRNYGVDPYGSYYTTPGVYFPVSNEDNRLQQKDFILGVVVNDKAKAYYPPSIEEKGSIEDTFEGKTFVAQWEQEIDGVRIYERQEDGSLERAEVFTSFWFAWAAAYPETELYMGTQ